MLRQLLLAVAIVVFAASALGTAFGAGLWPVVIWSAIIAVALGIERRLYGAARTGAPPPGWRATGERFRDEGSGHMVEVWFDPATGDRHYRRID